MIGIIRDDDDLNKNLTLFRYHSTENGTLGFLFDNKQMLCYTLERPWLNNEKNISCIPVGRYECLLRHSEHFGLVYEVTNVRNRTDILIHQGNCALSDSEGCILVGLQQSIRGGKFLVLNSRDAIDLIQDWLKTEISFNLTIREL